MRRLGLALLVGIVLIAGAAEAQWVAAGSGWVRADAAAGTTSPLTTKGDLFTFSTGPTRLGIGANDLCLVADSTQATGLKWAACGAGITNSAGANVIPKSDGTNLVASPMFESLGIVYGLVAQPAAPIPSGVVSPGAPTDARPGGLIFDTAGSRFLAFSYFGTVLYESEDLTSWGETYDFSTLILQTIYADSCAGVLVVGTMTGIYRSTDGGATWPAASTGPAGITGGISGLCGGSMFAVAGAAGTYRSTDSGDNWTLVLAASEWRTVVHADPESGVIHTGASSPGQLRRSTDDGLTWDALAQTGADVVSIRSTPTWVYVNGWAGDGGRPRRSSDLGATWVALAYLGSGENVLATNGENLYIGSSGNVFFSEDGSGVTQIYGADDGSGGVINGIATNGPLLACGTANGIVSLDVTPLDPPPITGLTQSGYSGEITPVPNSAVSPQGGVTVASLTIGTGGPSWTAGAGAPSDPCTTGSLYSRTDGGTGTTLYVCESAAWAAK